MQGGGVTLRELRHSAVPYTGHFPCMVLPAVRHAFHFLEVVRGRYIVVEGGRNAGNAPEVPVECEEFRFVPGAVDGVAVSLQNAANGGCGNLGSAVDGSVDCAVPLQNAVNDVGGTPGGAVDGVAVIDKEPRGSAEAAAADLVFHL